MRKSGMQRAAALFLCALFVLFLAAFAFETAAGPARGLFANAVPEQFRPAPAPRFSPNWTTDLPDETETTIYFWGFSGKSKDRREAETRALQDAKIRIAGYIFEVVEGNYSETSQYKNDRGHITENSEIISDFSQSYTKSILEGVKPLVSKPARNKDGTMEVQILVSVPKAVIAQKREEINKRVRELSAFYTTEIQNQKGWNLETLRRYEQIVSRLNLIERALVTYHGLARPVNLYTYITERIHALAEAVYVARVEFRGGFSDFEREGLFAALQNGFKNNGVRLQLIHTGNADFKIVLSGEPEQNIYTTFRWRLPGLALQFMQGDLIKESAYITVPVQVDRAWLMTETGKKISQEKDFFLKIQDIFKRG